ncbi:MAG: prepilin peptidase [Negativicutes bacterium]|nr:prepilin peptidase [Negativicutes bacterium]
MLYIIYLAVGLVIGRMLNMLINFLPKHNNIYGEIQSPRNSSQLFLGVLVPVIGSYIPGQKCRDCGSGFYLRRPIVELLTGVLFILCLYAMGPSAQLLKVLALTCFLIVISFIDHDHSLIFDNVLIPMAVIGVAINLLIGDIKIINMLVSALVGGGVFLLLAIIRRGGFGGGDIKFMACLGLWLGIKSTFITLLFSFILGGVGAAMLILFKRKKIKDKFPYGPYIAAASFITMLYGDTILNWYLHLFSQYR